MVGYFIYFHLPIRFIVIYFIELFHQHIIIITTIISSILYIRHMNNSKYLLISNVYIIYTVRDTIVLNFAVKLEFRSNL